MIILIIARCVIYELFPLRIIEKSVPFDAFIITHHKFLEYIRKGSLPIILTKLLTDGNVFDRTLFLARPRSFDFSGAPDFFAFRPENRREQKRTLFLVRPLCQHHQQHHRASLQGVSSSTCTAVITNIKCNPSD